VDAARTREGLQNPGRKHSGRRVIARLGWSAALAYMAFIFYLSSIPGEQLPLPAFFLSDKIAHFLAYAGLGTLIALRAGLTDLAKGNKVIVWTKGGWIGPAVGIGYGLFDEFHQLLTPHRSFDLKDWAVDIAGVLIGFWVARKWDERRVQRTRHRKPGTP
jgi:VanZ family protein